MVEIRNRVNITNFINYLKTLGIEVHTDTKARGNYGFCTGKRIDISKNLSKENQVDVLLHEFAHFVHFKLEPEIVTTKGTLEKLFSTDDVKQIEKELFQITKFVFDDINLRKIEKLKENVSEKIAKEREIIKQDYPDFQVNKKFKEFEKYIRFSNAKYLLKYDCVIIKGGWFSQNITIGIKSIEEDFPDMPKAFASYIRMKSYERKRNRLNSKKSKIEKYLKQPTELFARFFQFYCCDIEAARHFAPISLKRFEELKEQNYYPYLKDFEKECL